MGNKLTVFLTSTCKLGPHVVPTHRHRAITGRQAGLMATSEHEPANKQQLGSRDLDSSQYRQVLTKKRKKKKELTRFATSDLTFTFE